MLILTRRLGQRVIIDLDEAVDPNTPAGVLFADGPMEIVVTQIQGAQIKLGISAHAHLSILRNELLHCPIKKATGGAD
jgi:sRNA-binding carbon storage regulator CsrA